MLSLDSEWSSVPLVAPLLFCSGINVFKPCRVSDFCVFNEYAGVDDTKRGNLAPVPVGSKKSWA